MKNKKLSMCDTCTSLTCEVEYECEEYKKNKRKDNTKIKKALVLGRFQPVHIGHMDLFNQLKDIDLILVGICIKQRDSENPFSYDIRKMMIKNILKNVNHKIYNIPDINNPPNYRNHIENIIKDFDKDTIIVSGNPHTLICFKDYKHRKFKRRGISGTKLREKMITKKGWRKYIPKCNLILFEKYNLLEKLR